MAGALGLLLYGVAIFVSPVAVYFKKGVGVQFWVNCCLYCLLGVPGMIHAFYIIHTNKNNKETRRQTSQSPRSPQTLQRYSHHPSLPYPDRYKPPAPYSPYEDHPPLVPPKRGDTLLYNPSLHPNARGLHVGRAKAVLHTYQIPESTLHPPPVSQRARRSAPSPEPSRPDPAPELEPEAPSRPPPQLQTQSEPPPSAAPALDPNNPNTPLPYPVEYHPNTSGENIAKAKAVLHTYQIPEATFPAPESEPNLTSVAGKDGLKRLHPTDKSATGSKGKSMWSLRGRSKGLSTLDVNSPTAIPSSSSPSPRPRWRTGPSWLRPRRNPEHSQINATTTDEDDGPSTMTMVWDDKFDHLCSPHKSPGKASVVGGHTRSASDPVELPFPMPPGSVRPIIDRTGTSNTILRRIGSTRSESGLGAVMEEPPRPREVMSEEEEANANKHRWEDGRMPDPSTYTEAARSQHRVMDKLGRRVRPRLDTIGVTPTPDSAPSAAPTSAHSSSTPSPPEPDSSNQHRSMSSPLPPHIAPPAVLASSIDEPRVGSGHSRHSRTSNSASPTSPVSPIRSSIDFRIAEFGLGRSGDAYSAGSRALRSSFREQRERERRASLTTIPSPVRSPRRLSAASPTSDAFGGTENSTVPVIRRGLTQGTFGTGVTSRSATSEESPVAGSGSPRRGNPRSKDHVQGEEGISQDEQVKRWIRREDERRSQSQSRPPTSHGHSSEVHRAYSPDTASLFSEESSGFAGLGVGSAQEKGRAGNIEVWDRPDWDGSNPSASLEGSAQRQHARYHNEDPFRDPPSSTATHSSYGTGQESLPVLPLSPPTSPRPSRPTRPAPAPPEAPVLVKPIPLRVGAFGAGERRSFGLLSPPATERVKGKGKERAIGLPPPVPTRPGAPSVRPQYPELPPKPAILRSMPGGDEDDLSAVYARALRDEL